MSINAVHCKVELHVVVIFSIVITFIVSAGGNDGGCLMLLPLPLPPFSGSKANGHAIFKIISPFICTYRWHCSIIITFGSIFNFYRGG